MVPFGGWDMPVQYTEGILAEHRHARSSATVFDTCHMGEFRIKGDGAAEALDKALARAVKDQPAGSCRYNFLLTDRGTVIDDLVVYRISDKEFYLVVNAGTKDGDFVRLKELLPSSLSFTDESDATGKIDLQGPRAAEVMEGLGVPKALLPGYYKWIRCSVNGIPTLLSRTGYTGELGFELYTAADRTEEMWDNLLSGQGVKPAGLGARDTLRLEMAYPLYGHEMDDKTTPVEAGFGEMLKLVERREFAGASALRSNPPTKRLMGIVLDGRRAARHGGAVLSPDGASIGVITSGTFSPSLEKAIALAYIKRLPDAQARRRRVARHWREDDRRQDLHDAFPQVGHREDQDLICSTRGERCSQKLLT